MSSNTPKSNRPQPNGSGSDTPKSNKTNPNQSRSERIREVAKGQPVPTTTSQPVRRTATGTRTGSVSKKAQGIATPSEASRRAAERAAQARTQRTLVGLGIAAAVVLLGIIITSALVSNANVQAGYVRSTATAIAQVTVDFNNAGTQTAVAPTAIPPPPTVAYPLGAVPTAAPVSSPTNEIKLGPVAIDTTEGIATKRMIVYTNKGTITLDLYPNAAPLTVANYERRANAGEFNGRTFHRVEEWVIQGNDPLGNGTGGGNITTEINKVPFKVGSLGVARSQLPYSNDAQFFITKASTGPQADVSFLNGKFDAKGRPTDGYTNFGQVTSGQDVVDRIAIGDVIYTVIVEDKANPLTATAAAGNPPVATGSITATGSVTATTGTATNPTAASTRVVTASVTVSSTTRAATSPTVAASPAISTGGTITDTAGTPAAIGTAGSILTSTTTLSNTSPLGANATTPPVNTPAATVTSTTP